MNFNSPAEIARMSLFRGADEGAIRDAIGTAEVLGLPAGATLLHPGKSNRDVYLVIDGQLGAALGNGATGELEFIVGPGECLGELSSTDGKPVSALVRTLTDCRVLRLSEAVFWNRLMAVPGVARNLMLVLAERMRRNNEALLQGQRRRIELEHLQQELALAGTLQTGMLPLQNPLFPERPDIEVAGMMEPAATIGGDFFDAFFIDERRLFFCIGDVSGHGIAAAMFMARAITLMRGAAIGTACPGQLLGRVNDQLCAGNDANMFVTLFCGFLDTDNGRLVYANGGHIAPLYRTQRQAQALPMPRGTALGILPGLHYTPGEAGLAPDECLLCFTDGVTEAQTEAGAELSDNGLLQLLEDLWEHPLESLIRTARRRVAEHCRDDRLADDFTMLAIRRTIPLPAPIKQDRPH
jgi:sigma-B regulation protein RsbU (phosphoserine phosphatase)